MSVEEELDARIATAQTAMEIRRKVAEDALQRFLDGVVPVAKAWMAEGVKEKVTRDHETTARLGTEKVAALKRELTQMIDDAPKLVRSWLDQRTLWAHRADFERPRDGSSLNTHYEVFSRTGTDHSRDTPWPLRDAFGKVPGEYMLRFMQRHGYLKHGHAYFSQMSWNANLTALINAYAAAFEAFAKTQSELQQAKDARGRHDAASVWDKV